jgi:hypothetical protein
MNASGVEVARGVARRLLTTEAHSVQEQLKNELRKRFSDYGIQSEAHLDIAMNRSASIVEKNVVPADAAKIAEFVRMQYGGLFGAEPGTVAATPPAVTKAPPAQKPQQPPAPTEGEPSSVKVEGKEHPPAPAAPVAPAAPATTPASAKGNAGKPQNKKDPKPAAPAPSAEVKQEPKSDAKNEHKAEGTNA